MYLRMFREFKHIPYWFADPSRWKYFGNVMPYKATKGLVAELGILVVDFPMS